MNDGVKILAAILGIMALIPPKSKRNRRGSAFDDDVKDKPKTRKPDINWQELLGIGSVTVPEQDPNPQRYKIFWDCVERFTERRFGGEIGILADDGGFYGRLIRNQFMCNHNENDTKWSDCVTAAQSGVNQEMGVFNFTDLIDHGIVAGFELVIAAMPVDNNGYILPPHQGMALKKHMVVAAYSDLNTAMQNWSRALPGIQRACIGGDIEDIDNYLRT